MTEEMTTDRILQRTEMLKRTVRDNPGDAWSHCCLGVCYEELGLYNHAIEALNRAICLVPDFPLALRRLGVVYEKLGLIREGRRMVREAEMLDLAAKQSAENYTYNYSDLFGCPHESSTEANNGKAERGDACELNPAAEDETGLTNGTVYSKGPNTPT